MKLKPFISGFIVLMAIPFAWYAGVKSQRNESTEHIATTTSNIAVDAPDEVRVTDVTANEQKEDMRQRVAEVIESEAVQLTKIDSVDNYLAALKNRAIKQKKVTALEIEPGIHAIMNLESTIGPEETQNKIAAFTNEMESLSRTFDNRTEAAMLSEAALEQTLDKIASAETDEIRQSEIRKYMDAVDGIEDIDEKARMMNRLEEITAVSKKDVVAPADFDALASAISTAGDDATRRSAIQAYLEATQALDPEDQINALDRLRELTAPN